MRDGLGAVTFDCWNTLLYEPDGAAVRARREASLAEALRGAGLSVDGAAARAALNAAWDEHSRLWREGVASGAPEMARWALEAHGVRDAALAARLARTLADAHAPGEVAALPGARETLEALAKRGVRRALICDTGMSPGHVVRRFLDEQGLLEWLEVLVFSDEVGVPKPDPRVFGQALRGVGVEARRAVHVGDMRRTDVAGARGAGMASVRLRERFDDPSPLPDADHVADSHAHLRLILRIDR